MSQDFNDILLRDEELLPELAAWVEDGGRLGPMLSRGGAAGSG
jgi:hypothetical protein